MSGDPSYRSFVVRLWQEKGTGPAAWRGEVENIQSGHIASISSLDEALRLIRRTALGVTAAEENRAGRGPQPSPSALAEGESLE